MTPKERTIREALLAQGKLDFEIIERARKLEAPYLCAGLPPGSHSVDPEAIEACTRDYPSALAECGSIEWYTGLWLAMAHGYAGRRGVGIDAALTFSIGQLFVLYQNGELDEETLRVLVATMRDVRNIELSTN